MTDSSSTEMLRAGGPADVGCCGSINAEDIIAELRHIVELDYEGTCLRADLRGDLAALSRNG